MYGYRKQKRQIGLTEDSYNKFQKYFLLNNSSKYYDKYNLVLFTILMIWVMEWMSLFLFMLGEWKSTHMIMPIRTPTLLILLCIYWLLMWGISLWSSTQYGKFTSGERKLWAKALTAFWVAEYVTIFSMMIVYCWMSWGPLPLVPRRVMFSKRSLILEFTLYSYILFLAYMTKFSTSWCLWKFQYIIGLLVLMMLGYLLWRDISTLMTSEVIHPKYVGKWKGVSTSAITYTISHEWWMQHMLGSTTEFWWFTDLLGNYNEKNKIMKAMNLTKYESSHWVEMMKWQSNSMFFIESLEQWLAEQGVESTSWNMEFKARFYPRSLGFMPKSFSLWQLFMMLSMWHHLVMLIWWIMYMYRLVMRSKTSYSWLASCYFNVYCCYILAISIYLMTFTPFYEMYFSVSPENFNLLRFSVFVVYTGRFIWSTLIGV